MSKELGVVIPFYQRERGILARAIASALAQRDVQPDRIVVVDDGSPVSARDELADLLRGDESRIDVIEQSNAGPAAARNRGLNALSRLGVEYVAFLDSDDEWGQGHLSNAVTTLKLGYDLYFAGHQRSDWEVDKFNMISFIPDRHEIIAADRRIYKFVGTIQRWILVDHLIQSSTVVYRLRGFEDIRFPHNLVLGEDEIFWAKIASRTDRIAFCPQVESVMGKGVNVSLGADWDTQRSLDLMAGYMKFWKLLPTYLELSEQIHKIREEKISSLRRSFIACALHRIRRFGCLDSQEILKMSMADPFFPMLAGPITLSLLLSKIRVQSNN